MDYAATYLQVIVRYYVSNMILNINSNAIYLVFLSTKSQIAGYFYLLSNPLNILPLINIPILIICKTLWHVVSSAAKAEIARVFINAQIALPIQYALESLRYK